MNIKKAIILITFLFVCLVPGYSVTGFSIFSFGDSPTEISRKGEPFCTFDPVKKDTRWFWKSYLVCTDYNYKGVHTKLFFEFFDEELVKIYVVSRDIKDYFLIRHPQEGFLVPLEIGNKASKGSNLADELIFKDKEYLVAPGQKLTHFFFDKKWEWEVSFEDSDYERTNLNNMESQLEDEQEKGLDVWNNFKFDTPVEEIKSQLQSQCSKVEMQISTNVVGRRNFICLEYLFIQQKVQVIFSFMEDKLVQIKLLLPYENYDTYSPLLKKKYGMPYTELEKNKIYHPFIDFPQKGVTLAHNPLDPKHIYLRYQKEGFVDKDELMQVEEKKKALKNTKSKDEVILDNL
ncbi:MAG: hypothetical protein GY786_09180 [Proteobacteria bacterium]|nr:hypothetical protein [Pseudomonadota bacterium]